MQEILKAATKTGGAAVVSALLLITVTKILAWRLGPDGTGLYAVLDQVRLTILAITTLGGGTALVQGIANRKGQSQTEYIATALMICVVGIIVANILLIGLAPWITPWLTGRTDPFMISLIRWLALPISLFSIYAFVSGVLNGFRAIGQLAISQIIGNLGLAILAYPMATIVYQGQVLGFIGLMAGSALIQGAFSLWAAWRGGWIQPFFQKLSTTVRWEAARHLLSMSGSLFIVGQLSSYVMLAIIGVLTQYGGLTQVGIFNAAWGMSMRYVMLILTSFSTYYMPTLSSTVDETERIVLVRNVWRLTTLLAVPLIVIIVMLKPLIVIILYSDQFLASLKIIRWMLLGDYIKLAAYVVAMSVIAYADLRVWFASDSIWNVGFLVMSFLSIKFWGSIEGIGAAFFLLYLLYLGFYLQYVQRRFAIFIPRHDLMVWLAGFGIVLLASLLTWNDVTVNWALTFTFISGSTLFSWLTLTKQERTQTLSMLKVRWSATW